MLCKNCWCFLFWPDIKMKPVILTVFERKAHCDTQQEHNCYFLWLNDIAFLVFHPLSISVFTVPREELKSGSCCLRGISCLTNIERVIMASWLAVMLQKVYSQGCCTHTPSWVAVESRFIFFSIYLGSELSWSLLHWSVLPLRSSGHLQSFRTPTSPEDLVKMPIHIQ